MLGCAEMAQGVGCAEREMDSCMIRSNGDFLAQVLIRPKGENTRLHPYLPWIT